MKKILSLLILTFVVAGSFAQIQRTPSRQKTDSSTQVKPKNEAVNRKMQLLQELNLTPEQKVKVRQLREDHQHARDLIKNDSTLSEGERKEKLKSLRKQQGAKIQDILTEEQKMKFRELLPAKKNDD